MLNHTRQALKKTMPAFSFSPAIRHFPRDFNACFFFFTRHSAFSKGFYIFVSERTDLLKTQYHEKSYQFTESPEGNRTLQPSHRSKWLSLHQRTTSWEQSLKNIGYILEEAGMNYSNVVKTTCLLSDIANFAAMNEVYAKYFTSECPARAAFAVKDLPMGAMVEIEVVAVK